MTDIVTPDIRSRMMAGIRGKDTLPEMIVRRILFASGFRFRLHRRDLPGAPDIVLPGRRIAIFVHGCFWHQHRGCRFAKLPSTRTEFWQKKLEGNVARDATAVATLRAAEWRVLLVWECATRVPEALNSLPEQLENWINADAGFGQIGIDVSSP